MQTTLDRAITANLDWFEQSGVMMPSDGSWGVAERLVLTFGNAALEQTRSEFPARTEYADFSVIEHRRPDCNFQTALAYTLHARTRNDAARLCIAEKLLTYLYCRSASRNCHCRAFPAGTWRWSDDRWLVPVWFDDNAWCAFVPLLLAGLEPEFERRFQLREGAAVTAHELYHAMTLAEDRHGNFARAEYLSQWYGFPEQPHFGALACMALAGAMYGAPRADYTRLIESYFRFLERSDAVLNTSERCYALLGAAVSAAAGCNTLPFAVRTADRLLHVADAATGNLPSEHGREAPTGPHLVDLIYTYNWAVLGFQALNSIAPEVRYQNFLDTAATLLVRIQDRGDARNTRGCWRGMYDLRREQFGGGDCYEGGANSIYTGWTNAPLNCFLSMYRDQRSLITLLHDSHRNAARQAPENS